MLLFVLLVIVYKESFAWKSVFVAVASVVDLHCPFLKLFVITSGGPVGVILLIFLLIVFFLLYCALFLDGVNPVVYVVSLLYVRLYRYV